MDHFTFVLPLNKENLLSSDSVNQYVVEEVYQAGDLIRKLGECRHAISHSGYSAILEHFDSLFSVVYHSDEVSAKHVVAAYTSIIRGMENFYESLPARLEEDLDSDSRTSLLNMAKMYLYLFSEILRTLEDKFNKNTEKEMAVDAKSRKRAAKAFTDFDWDDIRGGAMIHLYNFVQQPLYKLWDPPVAEEDFVNLAANCCYKILEDPQVAQVRFKNLRETVQHVLGTLIKQYNHGLNCTVKIVQLLKLYEHLSAPLSEAAVTFVRMYESRHFIREVIREISEAEMAFDVNAPKACSLFLLEIARIAPEIIIQSMPLLIPHLESDSYMMRNCVLGVMGEIISSSLCEEQLTEDQRERRDFFLEHLEDHLLDTNAFVRSRTLKIWQSLCQEKAIPLSRLSQLLKHAISRLKDTSWSVTRSAIQLFCSLLESNPFGDKIELEGLQKKLQTEETILAGMKSDLETIIPPSRAKLWEDISPRVTVAIQDEIAKEDGAENDSDDGGSVAANIVIIAKFLDTEEYSKAFRLLRLTQEMFPEARALGLNRTDADLNWQIDVFLKLLKKIFVDFDQSQENNHRRTELTNEQKEAQEKVLQQQALTQYLKDCIAFAKLLVKATKVINNLLLCGQPTVIQDALDYLTAAYQFGLEGAMDGVRKMLLLVWSSESSVKEAVAIAYKKLYLEIATRAPGRSRADQIVRNLCALLISLDEDQQAALEVLVKEWVRNNEMDRDCIQIMWERFSMKLPDTTEEESIAALNLLSMVGAAEPNTINTNLNVLVTIGLNERGSKNFRLAKDTCRALLKLAPQNSLIASNDPPLRFERDHFVFQSICSLLKDGFLNLDDRFYTPLAYEAIDVIYQLSEHPDTTCAELLRHFVKLLKNNTPLNVFDEVAGNSSSNRSDSKEVTFSNEKIPVEFLNRFVFYVGHIAFRQWVHLDKAIFRELKRRNRVREEEEEKRRGDQEKNNKDKRKSVVNLNASILSRASGTHQKKDSAESPHKKDKDDADTEIGELNADDGEADYINQVCESGVVCNDSLLAALSPCVFFVCTNPQKFPDVKLRATACLALTKIMLVSSVICEQNLSLVFTMLEKSQEPQIRSDLVYAVGDLINRFPNQLEPWSKHLYSRLQDDSAGVRLDTIVVLKHLIMNDMVKVRAQISDMAVCIVDSEERISVMAAQFFEDLSKRANTLYNVLPDIISKLSCPEAKLSEERFHSIFEFLIPLIHKDKQMESLVEKLCQRLKQSTLERQWRDIAFCLSLLQYSERSLRRLNENFACFSDKLHSVEVHQALDTVINQGLKAHKQEKKLAAEELKAKIDVALKRGTGEERPADNMSEDEGGDADADRETQAAGTSKRTNGAKKTPAKRGNAKHKKARDNAQRRKRQESSEDDEESHDEETERPAVKSKRRNRR